MISIFNGTFSTVVSLAAGARGVLSISLLVTLIAVPCLGQNAPGKALPKVLMIEFQGLTPYDAGLYKAIRGQLSASPLILDRVDLAAEQTVNLDPLGSASRSADKYHAAMVFWIEDKETCRMFFFIPDASGGRINSRTLDLDLSSRPSRFEVIAIVAADMIEGLLVSRNLKTSPPNQKQTPSATPVAEKQEAGGNRKRLEIIAAYSGSFFATDLVSHGVLLGLGLFPIDHLVVAASFAQNLPLRHKNEEVQLTLISRQIEVLAAFRISIHPIDIRLGVSWSIDLRSFSTTSLSERIAARSDGFMGVHSLVPFISAAWVFNKRIGVFGRVGVNLTLNETIYKVSLNEGAAEALDPFVAKLSWQFGLVVLI